MMGQKNDAHFQSETANWYRSIPKTTGLTGENKPKAIVQFSAHYETPTGPIKITAQDKYDGLLYDYYGFPDHTYDVKYPCPGSTQLAKHIKDLLISNNIPAELDTKRGIDHGGFIPLMLMYPEAEIPVLQISICANAKVQRRIGEILAPLRNNGILFIGSGQASHGAFRPSKIDIDDTWKFVKALTKGLVPTASWSNKQGNETYNTNESDNVLGNHNLEENPTYNDELYAKRSQIVDDWLKIDGARRAHPHYDHYMPLPGCVGVTKGAKNNDMNILGDHFLLNIHSLRSFVFGEYPFKSLYPVPKSDDKTLKDEL
jgi:aromatic ring-opening dioxygenase catalytic subunit (LigB family)